jgi:hypothetical protein
MAVKPEECGYTLTPEEISKVRDVEKIFDNILRDGFYGKPVKICATHDNWLHLTDREKIELQRRYFYAGWILDFEAGIEQQSSCVVFTPIPNK